MNTIFAGRPLDRRRLGPLLENPGLGLLQQEEQDRQVVLTEARFVLVLPPVIGLVGSLDGDGGLDGRAFLVLYLVGPDSYLDHGGAIRPELHAEHRAFLFRFGRRMASLLRLRTIVGFLLGHGVSFLGDVKDLGINEMLMQGKATLID